MSPFPPDSDLIFYAQSIREVEHTLQTARKAINEARATLDRADQLLSRDP